ncbi:TonB-dependent receptor [Chitinophaga pinensis]|uniref:TonB-dependent receptor n=1 Tax=Chitinophaga pinensis (strain ATCC 43595 / DSM 2588 / LMG 13176 / NBRC 15968 / NCIMB 11800 / UQM 2034) TaxID=485918 RepID=A0A979G2N8_CHIPD|nr:hypothetical protein [Chitinophaga pinensis]ACU59817.1 hypothetical protein Cpin_2326 [Chitinophaga pinensis DSM 2588]
MNAYIKNIHRFLAVAGCSAGILTQQQAFAQKEKENLKEETIDIISNYRPKLRDAAKLNLTASLPSFDTTRPALQYQVPALNLYFMYQPIPLKPLALGKDSLSRLQNNFIKAGYGNLSTPLIQAGFGTGRQEKYNLGVYVNYTSSKGDIKNQDYSTLNILGSGTYFTPLWEINGSIGYDRNQIHYYGYDHATLEFSKNDVKQNFNQFTAQVGVKNRPLNDWAFRFEPSAKFIYFSDAYKRKEPTVVFKVPVSKQLFEDIYIKAEGVFDLSSFKEDDHPQVNNNVVAIHPALEIVKPRFMLHAGVNPTWTNSKFYLLPDIVNESHIIYKKVILSSGWISYINKNSFRNLANQNPFLGSYGEGILNTRVEEKYTGIKGTIGSHFNYNTKFAAVTWHNMPLFVNDSIDGKTFYTKNEEELRAFNLHAEVGYIQEEKFQLRLAFDWFNYNKQKSEIKPWGLIPFQADAFAQYTLAKKLHLNANLYYLGGTYYQVFATQDFDKTKGKWDLSAGANYDIGKNFNIWVNANNLFNSKYQRWYGYQTYGLNVVGGVMIKF